MRGRVLVLALLVVLAGCGSVPGGELTGPDSPAVTESATATAAAMSTVDPGNPWGSRTVTVGIVAESGDDRAYAPLVQAALDYWETHAPEFAGYSVEYELDPDAADPDIEIHFVSTVTGCQDIREAAGCAPYITKPSQIDRPEEVEVLSGLSNASTVLVVKHELGHTLGLDHDDEPQEIMSAKEQLTTLPQPNATDRDLPWKNATLSVYLDLSNVPSSERATVRSQVGHALTYYENGAAGTVPENVTFVRTDNRSGADILIRFPEEAPCGGGVGSCGSRGGVDMDGDGALEYYTKVEITVSGVPTEAIGWHVANWLGYGFGFTDIVDWPPPLREASAEERRNWWKNESAFHVTSVADTAVEYV